MDKTNKPSTFYKSLRLSLASDEEKLTNVEEDILKALEFQNKTGLNGHGQERDDVIPNDAVAQLHDNSVHKVAIGGNKDKSLNNINVKPPQDNGNKQNEPPVNDNKDNNPLNPPVKDKPLETVNFKDKQKETPLETAKDKPKEIVIPLETVKPNHKFKRLEPRDQVWQNVTSDGTLLVFSAGIFRRSNGKLLARALAMNGNSFFPKVLCLLQYDSTNNVTIRGKVWMLPDHHEKDYKTVFVLCPLPEDKIPQTLSIVEQTDTILRNALPVIYHKNENRQFTVCLSPLFFSWSIEYELIQWIELNKLIGADMFYVYNSSTVGRTDEILNHYAREGIVKVIQWHIPTYTDIHYYGQIAMMNDCLFRNIKVSRYMVNIDLDEYIVPRQGVQSWTALMPKLPPEFCEYSFRSSLVVTESKDVFPGKQMARELHLDVLLRNTRREYIFEKNIRTKYIVNTTCIDTVGIHFCWRYKYGTEVTQRNHVGPRVALMYHFRSEPVATKGKEVPEKAIYRYQEELIANVKARWAKIDSNKRR